MSTNAPLIAEFKYESAVTRKFLERVPLDRSDWKPHPKSMSIGKLAAHIAELPGWVSVTLDQDEFDFASQYAPPPAFKTNDELVRFFDELAGKALKSLENCPDERFSQNWTLRNGAHVYFTRQRFPVLRDFVFSHIVHHRAQLGVYLRLLDIPLPSTYGPTADDQ